MAEDEGADRMNAAVCCPTCLCLVPVPAYNEHGAWHDRIDAALAAMGAPELPGVPE